MSKLEDKIIKKVYKLEAKKTAVEILLELAALLVGVLFVVVVGAKLYTVLSYQESFSLLEIFQEDIEIIREYLFDTLSVFFEEIPTDLFTYWLIGIAAVVLVLVVIVKKGRVIRNKVKSLVKYWKSQSK